MRYATSLRLSWVDPFMPRGSSTTSNLWQSQWLSSASLREDGKLVVTIEDLLDHGPYGMVNLWPHLYHDDTAWIHPGTSSLDPQDDALKLLAVLLDPESKWTVDWKRWGSRGDLIYIDDAFLGDFGYIAAAPHQSRKVFVRLGNVKTLVKHDLRYSSGMFDATGSTPGRIPVQISIHCGTTHERATLTYSVCLKEWCVQVYWNNLLGIAQSNDVAIHDMLVVHEREYKAELSVMYGCSVTCCALGTIAMQDANIRIYAEQDAFPECLYHRCSMSNPKEKKDDNVEGASTNVIGGSHHDTSGSVIFISFAVDS